MKDIIYRQDAIDAVRKCLVKEITPAYRLIDKAEVMTELLELPSAEPVRCKDCKHSEHWYRDKRRCFLWHEEGIEVFDDGYCNYAERGQDATN